jgi:quinoprotein relay system zinc metallohydrolase 2
MSMKSSWCAAKACSGEIGRREVLSAGLGLACAALVVPRIPAAEGPVRLAPGALATTQVAGGVHVRRGVDEDANAGNDDAIANTAFIVGRESVAVVDPGGSLNDGRRLRARIRAVTSLPIRYVVMTHVHPDHIFGAGAFVADRPEFIGHARLANAMAARGEYYRATLEKILGKDRAGPVVVPTRPIAASERIDLGDRVLTLTAHGAAHSDCDLSVFDTTTGTLLTGDLLFVERVPALDAGVKGWQKELTAIKAVPARRAVPGHGPVSVNWPGATTDLDRYLEVVLTETRAAYRRGSSIGDAVATVGRSERDRWKLFDDYHGHNVTQAFKEVEWES